MAANRGEAAKALGISWRALQHKLKHYALLQPDDKPEQEKAGQVHSSSRSSSSSCSKISVYEDEHGGFLQ